jgi:hypothetical protein
MPSPAGIASEERMGFKQRERKRKRKAAVRSAQARSRASGSSADKWWLTITTRKCCCSNPACRAILKVGAQVVYRHSPMTTLCVRCADRDPEARRYRASARWERTRRRPKEHENHYI